MARMDKKEVYRRYKVTVPCRKENGDCPRRKCGCAAECPEWAEWVKYRELTREEKRRKNEAGRYQAAETEKTIQRAARYKKDLLARK